ncbi:MAG: hypothetical protein FJX46_16870 [Alphaproteobacteria bacterium]|nr:hypothetical protein [Alphaproteobacteria bacterium]
MNPDAVEWFAQRRLTGRAVLDLPDRFKPRDAAEAYAIQRAVRTRLIAEGRGPQLGWKIGITTPQMRAHLGVEQPIAGAVLRQGRHEPGATLARAKFARLGIECEVAAVLARPLAGPVGRDEVALAVGQLHPAIELVDDRYGRDYRGMGVPTLIADFAFHAGFVLGPPAADWRRLDLAAAIGTTAQDGVVRVQGRGADVMGHPFESIAWLSRLLAEQGEKLEAGAIVLCGSLPVPLWVEGPGRIEAAIAGLGKVGLTLT